MYLEYIYLTGQIGKKYNASELMILNNTYFSCSLSLSFLTLNDTVYLYQLFVANILVSIFIAVSFKVQFIYFG